MTDHLAEAQRIAADLPSDPVLRQAAIETVRIHVGLAAAEALARIANLPQGATVIAPTITRSDDTEKSRPAEPCPDCGGWGEGYVMDSLGNEHGPAPCDKCNGSDSATVPAIVQLDRVEAARAAVIENAREWRRSIGARRIASHLVAAIDDLDRAEGR